MMITATPDDSAVARARRDDTALWVATLRHTVAMTLLVWRAQIRRNHPLTLKSPLLSFLGGITVGVAIVWSFDLQSSMNGFIAATMPPSVLPVAANAVNFPRQDLPRHPTSLAVSAVPTTTPPPTVTKLTTAGEERRPTMTRTVAVSNRPDVSRGVTAAAAAPTPRFRGTLAIDSVVPGAQVFINGQPVGITPLLLRNVPAGSRAVRVEATGYGTWSASLQVTANRQTRVMAKLDPGIAAVSK